MTAEEETAIDTLLPDATPVKPAVEPSHVDRLHVVPLSEEV